MENSPSNSAQKIPNTHSKNKVLTHMRVICRIPAKELAYLHELTNVLAETGQISLCSGVIGMDLDPPFNSSRNYNVLFKDEHGTDSEAQITAFEDT